MSNTFKIEITTPGKLAFSGDVEMAIIPAYEGEMGILAGHAKTITTLQNGIVKILEGDVVKERFFVSGGFSEVNPEEVSILATEAENLNELDRKLVEQRISDAEIKLKVSDSDFEKKLAQESIELNNQILAVL